MLLELLLKVVLRANIRRKREERVKSLPYFSPKIAILTQHSKVLPLSTQHSLQSGVKKAQYRKVGLFLCEYFGK